MVPQPLIPRSLQDGWDYAPDWRHRIVEQNLVAIATAKDRSEALRLVLEGENDPYVRQGLRFRLSGRCVNQPAIEFAFRAHQQNPTLGLASVVRSMTIADLPPETIAEEVGTSRKNVVAYQFLFFDVRRYLGYETWLKTICLKQAAPSSWDPTETREAQLLGIAYLRGWSGLQSILQCRTPTGQRELLEISESIEAMLAMRALEFVASLNAQNVPCSITDLQIYRSIRETHARDLKGQSEQADKTTGWVKELMMSGMKSAQETNDPEHPAELFEPGGMLEKLLLKPKQLLEGSSTNGGRRRRNFDQTG